MLEPWQNIAIYAVMVLACTWQFTFWVKPERDGKPDTYFTTLLAFFWPLTLPFMIVLQTSRWAALMRARLESDDA